MMTTNALETAVRELEEERTDALRQRQLIADFMATARKKNKQVSCKCGSKPQGAAHTAWCEHSMFESTRRESAEAIVAIDARCACIRQEIHRLRSALDIDFTRALRMVLKERLTTSQYHELITQANARIETERIRILEQPAIPATAP